MLKQCFFDRDAQTVARELLGKVIRVNHKGCWLAAEIIETEAYYLADKASHASLGFTEKRKALFMPAGTIYMYYARGGDSLNVSSAGEGDAVLIKSAYPRFDDKTNVNALELMQQLNPLPQDRLRTTAQLCKGQTLLCRSLGLKVPDWDQQQFDESCFYIDEAVDNPQQVVLARRLGIPAGRDEHLFYRFINYAKVSSCTSNPLTKRAHQEGRDYRIEPWR